MCAEFGHAVHVDAVAAGDAERLAQRIVEFVQFQLSGLSFKTASIQDAAAVGKLYCLAEALHFIDRMDQTEAGAEQGVGLPARLGPCQVVVHARKIDAVLGNQMATPGRSECPDR